MLTENIAFNFMTNFVLSFALCTMVVLFLSNLAKSNNLLLDRPTDRKQHVGAVPLVGGLAIFLTYTVYSATYGFGGGLYVAALFLMIVGLIDDIVELSSGFRLVAQVVAALIIIYIGDARIFTVGNILGGSEVNLGSFSVLFTIMCVLGVINAINMIDGIDGLSGGITLLTILSLLAISNGAIGHEVALLMITLLGSLFAFGLFNNGYYGKSRKVFLGDTGSTVLGFLLAWLFITLSQTGSQPLSPVVAGWLFGLPLLDSVSVMVKRLKQGNSPFKADRNHLHHQLLSNGFSSSAVLGIMLSTHTAMLCIGVALNGTPAAEPFLFWGFVFLVVARHYLVDWTLKSVVTSQN